MSTLKLKGSTSGYVELTAPATAGDNTITLPTTAGTVVVADGSGNVNVSGIITATTFSGDGSGLTGVGGGSSITSGNTSAEVIDTGSDGRFVVTTEGSERARVDSSGRLLVGTDTARSNINISTSTGLTPFAQINTAVNNYNNGLNLTNYSATGWGPILSLGTSRSNTLGTNAVLVSADDCGRISFNGNDGTNFLPAAEIAALVDGTPGAGDMPGRLVFSTTADGASSPTERLRVDNGGRVTFKREGYSGNPGYNATGVYINDLESGSLGLCRSGEAPLFVNRLTSDGNLVQFAQNTTVQGTISVSGTTVSYNGAHLSRWSQILGIDPYNKTVRPEILRGTVMSNLDEMCDWTCPTSGDCQDNEQLNKTKISDVEGDKNVAGIFQSWDDDDDTWVNDYYLAMTGDFVIRIAAGITVERGDLLMSAGDGTAKPQVDDLVRSCTVAKVTSTTVSCTHPDGSYCVPCVLMAC